MCKSRFEKNEGNKFFAIPHIMSQKKIEAVRSRVRLPRHALGAVLENAIQARETYFFAT